ncbi:MAG: hypothetical protein ACOCV3_03080 [Halanaerobiales bacterium]
MRKTKRKKNRMEKNKVEGKINDLKKLLLFWGTRRIYLPAKIWILIIDKIVMKKII